MEIHFHLLSKRLQLSVTIAVASEQVKCDQYWPARGTATYGMIQVTMLDTVELATYTIRTFALYKVNASVRKQTKNNVRNA